MKLFSVLVLTLISSTVFAGPGVSSGDGSTSNTSYFCNQPAADSSVAVMFDDADSAKPLVALSLGESESQTYTGECSQLINADAFFINCDVAVEKDVYHISLFSSEAGEMKSIVQKMGSDDQSLTLQCIDTSK